LVMLLVAKPWIVFDICYSPCERKSPPFIGKSVSLWESGDQSKPNVVIAQYRKQKRLTKSQTYRICRTPEISSSWTNNRDWIACITL